MPIDNTYSIVSPNTGDTFYAQAPEAQRILWKKGVDVFEQSSDFFQEMEGESKGRNGVIWTETDTSKGEGQKIRFTNMSGFYNEPHYGDDTFDGPDDFETININSYELDVDFIRWATAYTRRMQPFMGLGRQIQDQIPVEIGKWLGRTKAEKMFMMFLYKLNAQNMVFAGDKTQDTLVASDNLLWDEIVKMGAMLEPLGGTPAMIGKGKRGNPIFRNMVVATTAALTGLKLDPNYKEVLRQTRDEAAAETLFTGDYVDIDGHVIRKYNPIDHDGVGAIGSALNAKASLANAIAPGTAAVVLTGGGNPAAATSQADSILFFKLFPNFAYTFLEGDVLDQDGNTHYVLAVNPAVAGGGGCMYAYTTGNNGNEITCTARLGSAAGGTRVTELGNVTWNSGVWAGWHTETIAQGALIIPCNANGTPFGDTLMLMKGSAIRGYGSFRNLRTEEIVQGGHNIRMYVTTVFGQTPRQDRLGRTPGALRLRHAISYPGWGIPRTV